MTEHRRAPRAESKDAGQQDHRLVRRRFPAARFIVHGRAVMNLESLTNPGALALFRNLPELVG